jgi:hypothetical protein
VQKALQSAMLSGLLLLAAYLRIAGLNWGLNSGYGHDLNFQPDEFVSLRGVRQVDLLAGRFKTPDAYFEGTFNYYLWALPQAILKIAGKKDAGPFDSTTATDQSDLLYICRWMSVLFDLCTVVIVFLAIREASRNFYASLVGVLCYSVIPMQVIYAHFMRTHILSNLLCALVIWISLKLRQSQRWQMLLGVGVLSGLGAATRYPVGIIVVIPCISLLFKGGGNLPNSGSQVWERTRDFITGPLWLITLGFVIGLFLGHPMLLLDPSSVTKAITGETLKYASLNQFSGVQLLNLAVVGRYITYVIPFAMYPLLWLVPYFAILYLLFRRRLYAVTIPILIFSILYLYFMGKGYLGPYFARITMVLFPGFCVLVGVACADLLLKTKNHRTVAFLLTCALLLALGPSVAFDVAYGHAMQEKDAREVLRSDLQKLIGDARATIGIFQFGPYFYTSMPAAKPLASEKVAVQLRNPDQDADFFLIGLPTQIEPAQMSTLVRQVEAQGKFTYERSYRVPVKIFGYEFKLVRFPQDMTYPFPTILLFRARTPT